MENALIIALIILFLHATTWDGHIFEGIRKYISEDSKISKPIYNCPICMTPWWGTVIYWLFFAGSYKVWSTWQDWLLTVGAASGFGVISVILIHAKDFFSTNTKYIEEKIEEEE